MSGRLPLPHIPGVDAAGVVDELGSDVDDVAIGDEGFRGCRPDSARGSERRVRRTAVVGAQAAGHVVAACRRGRFRHRDRDPALDLQPGMTLLIDGAAGGVGSIAVQLAALRGVKVIGNARPANHDFLAGYGVTPVTYGPGLADRSDRVDRALDVAGAGSVPELVALTGDPVAVVTLADFAADEHGVRLSMGRLAGEPGGGHGLRDTARLLTVPVEATFPFDRAADAHRSVENGSRRGKNCTDGLTRPSSPARPMASRRPASSVPARQPMATSNCLPRWPGAGGVTR